MMGRITGLSKSRLALWLGVFFIALAIPSGLLISQAYDQLKWEAFHRHRLMAEEFVARLDQYFGDLVASQNSLAFTDFQFLNIASDGRSGRYQPSSLSKFPVEGEIPGTLGYFQVDNEGRFSTPLVSVGGYSHDLGVSQEEARARMTLHQQLFEWLHDNQLVEGKPGQTNIERAGLESSPAQEESAPAPLAATIQSSRSEGLVSQKAFDRLKETADNRYSPAGKIEKKFESGPYASDSDLGRVEDLPLEAVYEEKLSKVEENKSIGVLSDDAGFSGKPIVRREQNAVIESENERMEDIQNAITIFESEIEPFDLARLGTGHFLLYRKVWREDERYIQGMLIDPQELLSVVVGEAFSRSPVANASELTVAFDGAVLSGFGTLGGYGHSGSDEAISGMLLLKTSLSAPLNNLQLIFSLVSLPAGEAARLLAWTTLILLLVLSGGLVLMYRLGVRQINLVEQQQDFVSAVSHELKTPLTSIRMYGEMLREGWVDESKRNGYYDFIFDESERLTRLINNVLALARMTRSEPAPDLRSLSIEEIFESIESKTRSQIMQSGFSLKLDCTGELKKYQVEVDEDFINQVFINLIDNAIKFSSKATMKQIDLSCKDAGEGGVMLCVRDYGPGIDKLHMRRIFRLFYRAENELTRETVGTGIGLSLVQQLIAAMKGEIDVVNRNPGVEFQIRLPIFQ